MNLRSLLYSSDDTLTTGLGLLALRLFAGLAIAFGHGVGKLPPTEGFVEATANVGFPLPVVFAWAAGLSEFLGGLLVALGLMTRPASLFLLITMLVAAFGAHGGEPFGDKEMALLYGAVFLCTLLAGSGRFGLDRFLAPRRRTLSFA
jgi:putative oxidoreductase